MEFLGYFLTSIGGAAVALAVAAFITRRLIDLQLQKGVEKYRSELEQKSAIIKTELSIYAHEKTVGLSRIDAQRSDAIQLLYKHVRGWHVAFKDMVRREYSDFAEKFIYDWWTDAATKTRKQLEGMEEAVSATAILFEKNTHDLLLRYVALASELTAKFDDTLLDFIFSEGDQRTALLKIDESRSILADRAQQDLEPMLPILLAEFRKLMHAEHHRGAE